MCPNIAGSCIIAKVDVVMALCNVNLQEVRGLFHDGRKGTVQLLGCQVDSMYRFSGI